MIFQVSHETLEPSGLVLERKTWSVLKHPRNQSPQGGANVLTAKHQSVAPKLSSIVSLGMFSSLVWLGCLARSWPGRAIRSTSAGRCGQCSHNMLLTPYVTGFLDLSRTADACYSFAVHLQPKQAPLKGGIPRKPSKPMSQALGVCYGKLHASKHSDFKDSTFCVLLMYSM